MPESHFTVYNNSKLHYVKAGNGKVPLLFFHGFGQDHTTYLPIIESIGDHYTVYIFDLYFHGLSEWAHDELPLEKSAWGETIDYFIKQNAIENFKVAGYSLGAKFALATLEHCPDKCRGIFLIAPDGIKTNFWYSLATYPILLRRIFKSMIGNYGRFKSLINLLSSTSLVDKGLIRFADYQMGTEGKRKRVYYSWIVFRRLRFNLKEIAAIIQMNHIALTIVVGRYDKVIPPKNMKLLTRYIPQSRLIIEESGHTGLLSTHTLRKFLRAPD